MNRFTVGSPLVPPQIVEPIPYPGALPGTVRQDRSPEPKLVEYHRAAENPQTGPLLWGILFIGAAVTIWIVRRRGVRVILSRS